MKQKLLFLLLFATTLASAQIVNIPDAGFKSLLADIEVPVTTNSNYAKDADGNYIIIDANEDGEIQVSEAEAVWELYIFGASSVSVTGIESFVNLQKLQFEVSEIFGVDLTSLVNLEEIILYDTFLVDTAIQVQGLGSLKDLRIVGINTGLLTLDLTGVTSLERLDLIGTAIQEIDFTQLTDLTHVEIDEAYLTSVDLSQAPYLEYLKLNIQSDDTNMLVLGNKPLLSYLDLQIDDSAIGNLDISGCIALTTLILDIQPAVSSGFYLNLKNGISSYENLDLEFYSNSGNPLYVCIDEGNEDLLPEADNENAAMFVSSYCSFMPGGSYNTISGTFTYDADNNGCDGDDSFAGLIHVDVDYGGGVNAGFGSATGNYNFYSEAGTFTLTPQVENSDWYNFSPATASVNFADDNNNVEEQNFCVTPNGVHDDMEIVVFPQTAAQPGFNVTYRVVLRNNGNQPMSGMFVLNYDDAVFDFVQANTPLGAGAGYVAWSYTDLMPFQTKTVFATLNLNGPTETPAVNIDDQLVITATVPDITNDEDFSDNIFVFNDVVVGSYDPNDITCLEGETVSLEKVGHYLHYNIRFENTGTAPATFVVVKDTINEEMFDVGSLQLLYASHPVQTRITGNVAEFYFGDINLAANGGKGNVVFKIKTISTLQHEDMVAQQAGIYFDYNWPVITNEYETTFEDLSAGQFAGTANLKVYPNPTGGFVTIEADVAIDNVSLYDIQGRLLQQIAVDGTRSVISLEGQQSGVYVIKVHGEGGASTLKVVKQ